MSVTQDLLAKTETAPPGVSTSNGKLAPLQLLRRGVSLTLIAVVRVYQCTLSPLHQAIFGPCCRFYPSCSQYFIQAVKKYGPIRGVLKGVGRLCRCHPWHPGGIDLP